MLGANAIFMDAFYTDVRPALARVARRAADCPQNPMARLRRIGLPGHRSPPNASAAPNLPGAPEQDSH